MMITPVVSTLKLLLSPSSFCVPADARFRCNYVSPYHYYQVLYPVLMLGTVWRTILVRVRPNVLLVFNSYADDGVDSTSPNGNRTFISRFKSSWKEDYSLFSWADKGQWETAQTGDRQASREGDWFRIGFEPVFVDYTKSGTWFVVISLVEVRFARTISA